MALNFPASPTTGDKYVCNSKIWIWDGVITLDTEL